MGAGHCQITLGNKCHRNHFRKIFLGTKNSAYLGDKLLVKTYVSKYKGAVCHRIVEITNKTTNTLLATSETKWCLIDAETKRPTRITKEISVLFE